MSKPILCLDFDGVCHQYTTPWQAADIISDPPVEGLFEFLDVALDHFHVAIYSSRSGHRAGREAMQEWFWKHVPVAYTHVPELLDFPGSKPPAFVGLDDRVITFTGEWPKIEALLAFKPWNKKG